MVFNGLTLMTTEAGGSSDWETAKTWNLFGDPSLQIRTSAPEDLTLTNMVAMAGIPFNTTVSTAGGPVEGAMVAITQGDSTWAAVTDAMGSVEINHNLTPGDALLVVTAFNTETVYETITVVPPSGAFLLFYEVTINDATGNNNGMLDYAEQVLLSLTVENVGTEDATGVTVKVTTEDEYITVLDSLENFGTIPAGSTVTMTDAYEIVAAGELPDMHTVVFDMEAEDGTSDEIWTSVFHIDGHAPVHSFIGFMIDDPDGNGNGKLDPGETAEFNLDITNTGSSESFDVTGLLSSNSDYITINNNNLLFGNMAPGATSNQVFSVSADAETPEGHSANFTLYMNANHNVSDSTDFYTVVGQIPVLVIDFDKNNNSADAIAECLDNLAVGHDQYDAMPENPSLYASIFVCLGIYPDNHILTEDQGQALADYLASGGNLYMEGGDTWYYDQQYNPTLVHPMFMIDGLEDGTGDLTQEIGMEGTMCHGMDYDYSGENNYIDHIGEMPGSEVIFMNASPQYGTVISYDGEDYNTIGSAFEFGGLDDGEYTKDDLMIQYLSFFGIDGIWVSVEEPEATRNDLILSVFPNPVRSEATLALELEHESEVTIDLLTMDGRVARTLESAHLQKGAHTYTWNPEGLSGGVYFVRVSTDYNISVRKVIIH
jgi:hypothetical protein